MIARDFPGRLKEKINEEVEAERGRLGTGMAADWPDYKYRAGILAGLKKAADMIDDIDDKEIR